MHLLPLFFTVVAETILTTAIAEVHRYPDSEAFADECYRLAGKPLPKRRRKKNKKR